MDEIMSFNNEQSKLTTNKLQYKPGDKTIFKVINITN